MAEIKENVSNLEEAKLAQQILAALKAMRFGTVQITVHNGKVTQIDKIERIRLGKEEPGEKAGS